MIDKLIEHAKDILFYTSRVDLSFPRSCGTVSSYIHNEIFKNAALASGYSVFLVRGHYIVDTNEKCFMFDLEGEIELITERQETFEIVDFPCTHCSCDNSITHTWLEFKNNKTGMCSILDFTAYQFHEAFSDLDQSLCDLSITLDRESLYVLLDKYGPFVIKAEDAGFKHYYPDEYYYNLEDAQEHESKTRVSLHENVSQFYDGIKQKRSDVMCEKKLNVEYWDSIEVETAKYLKKMLEIGGKNNLLVETEDVKEIVAKVTELLEKEYQAVYPFVNENY